MSEPTKIRVFNYKTKENICEYDSINDAARDLRLDKAQIRGYFAGRTNEVKSYGFKRITPKQHSLVNLRELLKRI